MAAVAQRIAEFDTWRPGFANALVEVQVGGTTTRARIFTDPELKTEVDNPVTLLSADLNGVGYGKFSQSLYTATAYQLLIDGTDKTGIVRPPLFSLVDEDGSFASSKTARGKRMRRLIDRFNDKIRAEDFGDLGETTATNTATINAAIGAAAGAGGGDVELPAGNFAVTSFTLPVGVRLVGQGRSATTLRSTEAEAVITLGGDRSGLRSLTLDGTNLVAGSIGLYAVGIDEINLADIRIRRFERGLVCKGGRRATWRGLYVENCQRGVDLLGDKDAGASAIGDQLAENSWRGGRVSQCTVTGLRLSFEDDEVRDNYIEKVGFEENTADALQINGARQTTLVGCWWRNNVDSIRIQDDSDTSQAELNTVIGLSVIDGSMNGGNIRVDGTAQDIIFEGCRFEDVDWILNLPDNLILLRDCIEDQLVTITGDGTKLIRLRSTLKGEVSGVTLDATATTAWSYELAPGQVAYAEAKIIGRQSNGEDYAVYHIAAGARRPGATLSYDNQTAAFGLGNVLTGANSGATARIVADADAGATGDLTLQDIRKVFQNNEPISDSGAGAALVNGVLVPADAALDSGGVTALRAAVETDVAWNATFTVSGGNLQLQVTGAVDKTVEWTVHVELFLV